MYLLDTNVLSAMMRPVVDPAVANWLRGKPVGILNTASICQAEILAGLALLPDSRRKEALTNAAEAMFREDFADRVLSFDSACAEAYARLLATTRRQGQTIAAIDLMIGAIANRHGARIVTRTVADFRYCDPPAINPWAG